METGVAAVGAEAAAGYNVITPAAAPAVSKHEAALDALKNSLHEKGLRGIIGLSRRFRAMDHDGNNQLDLHEFTRALAEFRDISEMQIEALFRWFDKDNSGAISLNEFLVGIRGELSEARQQLVKLAFDVLDHDGSGKIGQCPCRRAFYPFA